MYFYFLLSDGKDFKEMIAQPVWEQGILGAWDSKEPKRYMARAFESGGQERDFSLQNHVFESKV